MLRLIATVTASVLAITACTPNDSKHTGAAAGSGSGTAAGAPAATAGSGTAAPAGGSADAPAAAPASAPATTIELVQRGAAKDAHVAPADLVVPGIELFVVTDANPAADGEYSGGALVGVTGGAGGKRLEHRELVQAAIAAKPDPKVLARLAMRVAQRDGDGELLEAAKTPKQRKAKVTAPAIKGGKLVFWVWTSEAPQLLERGTLDLSTAAFALEPVTVSHNAAVLTALAVLNGGAVSRYASAIDTLVGACGEPRPRQALLTLLSSHPRDRTRAAIANEIRGCGPAAVDPLINLMELDKAPMVRAEAAGALGRIGDPRARAALAKAARSDDANLAWAAKNALGKLK